MKQNDTPEEVDWEKKYKDLVLAYETVYQILKTSDSWDEAMTRIREYTPA